MVANAAADMQLLRPDAATVYASVRLCDCVSAGDGGIKSHFLIRKGPSWPKALLQLELVQHRTGTTGFVRLLAKNLLGADSQTTHTCTHTHTYISLTGSQTNLHDRGSHSPPDMSCQMENTDYLSLQFTMH